MTKLRITLVHSAIRRNKKQKLILQALGFRKLNQTVEHDDVPTIRGMIKKIPHLVKWETVE